MTMNCPKCSDPDTRQWATKELELEGVDCLVSWWYCRRCGERWRSRRRGKRDVVIKRVGEFG